MTDVEKLRAIKQIINDRGTTLTAVIMSCIHCKRPYSEHPQKKCLFEPTVYKPYGRRNTTRLQRAYYRLADKVVQARMKRDK